MLKANPTKSGTGISIYGDFENLTILYSVIQNIADSLDEDHELQSGQFKLLMNFAYEIRKAKDAHRLKEKIQIENDTITYYGTQFIWPDILIFSNVLRQNAGYLSLNKLKQSFVYLLEYIIENALMEYDPVAGENLKSLIGKGLSINQKYIFQIYQTIHYNFVRNTKGEKRFRDLYKSLNNYLSSDSTVHKNMMKQLEESAKRLKCDIMDIEVQDNHSIEW